MGASPLSRIRVVALDDHPLIVEGMVAVLAREADLTIDWLGAAGTLADFDALLQQLSPETKPDLALIDLRLPDGSPTSVTVASLVAMGVRCIVVTTEVRAIPLRLAVQAGAQALYLKNESVIHFADVVRRVMAGEELVTSDIAAALLEDSDLVVELTPREHEVMTLLADGLPRKLVGKYIGGGMAQGTVTTHINRVVAKYRAQGRSQGNVVSLLREIRRDGHLTDEE